ncbi:MAG: hypothetical protein A2033_14585 [Bacteroidetes bacterium GWA2_31_9]|nr:MAG: hypothetical protein A2033_14585 [Bacteroidetes bacterium GWA2_31_9]
MVWFYGINHANHLCKSVVQTIGVSKRAKLESKIDLIEARLKQINDYKINYYIENNDETSVVNLLESSDFYEDKKTLANIYMSKSDYSTALQIAEDAVEIAQSSQVEEAENFVKLLNIRIDLAQNEKTIFDINTQQEQALRDMASVETPTGTEALIILEAVYGEEFEYPILKFGNQARSMSFNDNISGIDSQNFNSGMFNIYPNPNDGKMYLDYELETDGILLIYDKTGRIVSEYKLTSGKNKLSVNNLKLESGAYTYRIATSTENLKEGKLVIIK